jgi:predicted Zn-dependent peptidase
MDQLAIHYGTQIRMEQGQLTLTVLARYLEPALELMADLVLQPAFPDEELEKARSRWRSHLLSQRSQPVFLARERSHAALYGNHPYSRVSFPVTDVEKADRESLLGIHRRVLTPQGSLLAFSGAVNPDQAARLAKHYLGGWRGEAPRPDRSPLPPVPESRRVMLVHRPHSVQARIVVAIRALPRGHRDGTPLFLANQVLGGSASSRLFLNLREDKGYTYGASTRFAYARQGGFWVGGTAVQTSVTTETLLEMHQEIESIGDARPVTAAELSTARQNLVRGFAQRFETLGRVADQMADLFAYDLPLETLAGYPASVDSVTLEQVQAAARGYLDPSRLLVVVVGDLNQLEDPVRRLDLGPVEVVDPGGKPVSR